MPLYAIRPPRSFTIWCSALLISVLSAGCDKSPSAPVADSPLPSSASPTSDAAPTTAENSTTTDQDPRTKWLGDIPYDVFFDRPLEVANEGNPANSIRLEAGPPTGGSTDHNPSAEATTESPETPPPAITTSSDSTPIADWQRLASIEVLNEEVKHLRNRLTTDLKTVATYNRNIEAIANDSVVLAALAAVVSVHPGALSWQGNAKFVRDLAANVSTQATGTGREPFNAAQTSFEQIVSILNGGPPPEMDAAGVVPFSEVADRSELMKRTKRSFDWLKSEINTADRFNESTEDIRREATVLAVFGGLISTDSYDSSDEPQYQQFAREFVDANLAITTAVEAKDYEQFTIARDRVQNACAACHGEYAFGDEGL